MNRPDFVVKLDQTAGRQWTPCDVTKLTTWLMEREQERLVWYAAHRYLGQGVDHEDVEDAWTAFYTDVLEAARLSYKPGGPDFITYALHVCFKRECIRRGEAVRSRRRLNVSLEVAAVSESTCDDELVDTGADPARVIERKHLIDEISHFLVESAMPEQQRRAFELKHFAEMSNEEISWEMGAEVGTVKVWAHRASTRVRDYLKERGWGN